MNMTVYNKGRLQSSFWIVDKQHVYIGSAGLDWRSLGQVTFHRAHSASLASQLPVQPWPVRLSRLGVVPHTERLLVLFLLKIN